MAMPLRALTYLHGHPAVHGIENQRPTLFRARAAMEGKSRDKTLPWLQQSKTRGHMSCLFDVGVDCQVVTHIISHNPIFAKSTKENKSNLLSQSWRF